MAKPSKKKSHAAKSKIKNKFQSKKNSSRNRKRHQKKQKNQPVTVQKQVYQEKSFTNGQHNEARNGDGLDDENVNDYFDALGPDATLDDIDYLLSHHGNLSFLSQPLDSDEPRKKKKKSENDDLKAAAYETQPRKLGNLYEKNDFESRVHLLPLKGEDGLIQRSIAKDDETKEKEDTTTPEVSTEDVQNDAKKELSVVEIYAEREKTVKECKMTIAHTCEELLENPEANLKHLKKLLEFCAEGQFIIIQKLSMISLCEVFKDIVPGYRIRQLTDAEKSAKVSKDVKKLREFEQNLVMYYKKYLDRLEEAVQAFVSKRGKSLRGTQESMIAKRLALTAVTCMTDILASLSHFNYRTNLIVAVVSKVNFGGERSEIADVCLKALETLFTNDEVGDVSLEAMKVVARMAKSNLGKLRPQVLETLLHLNIDVQLIKDAESRESKIERLRRRKEQLKKMSRKERKRKKLETKLDKELEETQATESKKKIQQNQTEILKFVFVIYFRVLKQEKRTSLLTPVLKGLAKYAYLINVDFFNDLMAALQRLINSGELSITESMSCVLTAFKILSGQGEMLNIDPHNFYLHLYNSIVDIAADSNEEDIDICIECLNLMLIKRRKQVSLRRIQGFVKRIATVSLQQETEQLFSFLVLLRSVLQLNQKCDQLLDNERLGRGVFQPELPDPEHCNADSTALWELSFLNKHYSTEVNQYSKHLSHGAPSQGQHSLSSKLIQRKELRDYSEPPLEYFLPDSIPPQRKAKKVRKWTDVWYQPSLKDYVNSIDSNVHPKTSFDFAKYVT